MVFFHIRRLNPTVNTVGVFYTVLAKNEGGTNLCNLPVSCRTDI